MDIYKLEYLFAKALSDLDIRLVQMRTLSVSKDPKLEILIERLDRTSVNVDECIRAHRTLSALLTVEDPSTADAYIIEVSSPGIDRPLITEEDYHHYSGYKAMVETSELVLERKRFRGSLIRLDSADLIMEVNSDDGVPIEVAIPFHLIVKGKLDLEYVLEIEQAKRKSR
jgi:ribosome maturation factor RimP